ncbi:hypothetical protein [uncultured Thiocystis sp.]|uniref:hypothetical protein n=1 Tax=uncultured Thiocystis sp. TaxID=1202134 RepID=UPI0025DCE8D4|nr:hypothetical protein [uncultured Thiocystis sp.]
MTKIVQFLLILFFAGFLAPLYAEEASPPDAEQARVEQRVRAYLDALKIQDLHTAYRMESGAVDGTLTADAFFRRFKSSPSVLLNYEIQKVTMESDKATVEFSGTYQYPQLHEPATMPRRAEWVLIDGEWYHSKGQVRQKLKAAPPADPG